MYIYTTWVLPFFSPFSQSKKNENENLKPRTENLIPGFDEYPALFFIKIKTNKEMIIRLLSNNLSHTKSL